MAKKSKITAKNTLVNANLAEEVRSLRGAVNELTNAFKASFVAASHATADKLPKLEVFITQSNSERKPYLIRFEGFISGEIRFSPIRATILLILLLDLEDRLSSGKGLADLSQSIADALPFLDSTTVKHETTSVEKIRVALYRFWDFCESEQFFVGKDYSLIFSDKAQRLICIDKQKNELHESIIIEITSDDPQINLVLAQNLTRSPATQVRRRRALYVPSGIHGSDQFLLEMYQHPHQLKVTSLYVRPPLITYPLELLRRIGVSDKILQRKELALDGYRTGRFQFFEVLQEDVVWDLIRQTADKKKFKHYPAGFTKKDVASHLENLIAILTNYENYHFYITRAQIPFALVTYEIRTVPMPEYFTVFFDSFGAAAAKDLGCFALCDPAVYKNISDHIIQWIMQHPSTIREREQVKFALMAVLDRLESKGSLKHDETHPEFVG